MVPTFKLQINMNLKILHFTVASYGVDECIKYEKLAKYDIMTLIISKYAIKLKECRNMHTVIPKI